MTTIRDKKDSIVEHKTLIRRLREVVEALDRRVPHPERAGETRIAREAAALKEAARDRIAELI